MKMYLLAFLLSWVAISAARAEEGPSFDCSKAHSNVEQAICADTGLSRLDLELSAAYRLALQGGTVDKKSQIDWIKRNGDCITENHDQPSCLRKRFERRIAELTTSHDVGNGQAPQSDPSAIEAKDVCSYVATRGPTIAKELIRDGALEANNDGRPYQATISGDGTTAGGDNLEFRPMGVSPQASAIEIDFGGGDRLGPPGGFGARWLKRGRRVYTLHFDSESLHWPSYLGYIDPVNVEHTVCQFGGAQTETLVPDQPRSAGLCRAAFDDKVRDLDLNSDDADDAPEASGRPWTTISGSMTVDFRNIGRQEPIALLEFDGAAGRGCAFSYYEATKDGRPTSTGEAHIVLMKLQNADPDGHEPGLTCGGNEPSWFEYGGKIYFDNKSPSDPQGPYHTVSHIKGDQIERICHAEYTTKWTVKSYGSIE